MDKGSENTCENCDHYTHKFKAAGPCVGEIEICKKKLLMFTVAVLARDTVRNCHYFKAKTKTMPPSDNSAVEDTEPSIVQKALHRLSVLFMGRKWKKK